MDDERKMVVISTLNISKEAASFLIDESRNPTLKHFVVHAVWGVDAFLLPLYPSILTERKKMNDSLEMAIVYAMGRGVQWLMIDPLANENEILATYDWN